MSALSLPRIQHSRFIWHFIFVFSSIWCWGRAMYYSLFRNICTQINRHSPTFLYEWWQTLEITKRHISLSSEWDIRFALSVNRWLGLITTVGLADEWNKNGQYNNKKKSGFFLFGWALMMIVRNSAALIACTPSQKCRCASKHRWHFASSVPHWFVCLVAFISAPCMRAFWPVLPYSLKQAHRLFNIQRPTYWK